MEPTGDNTGVYDSNTVWGPALDYDARLFSCDEHAFCHGCQYGNRTFCEAVATYYGGVGVPYDYNGTHFGREWFGDPQIEYIGANAAFQAINNDWDMWCAPSTLASIKAGTFREDLVNPKLGWKAGNEKKNEP